MGFTGVKTTSIFFAGPSYFPDTLNLKTHSAIAPFQQMKMFTKVLGGYKAHKNDVTSLRISDWKFLMEGFELAGVSSKWRAVLRGFRILRVETIQFCSCGKEGFEIQYSDCKSRQPQLFFSVHRKSLSLQKCFGLARITTLIIIGKMLVPLGWHP